MSVIITPVAFPDMSCAPVCPFCGHRGHSWFTLEILARSFADSLLITGVDLIPVSLARLLH